MSTEEYNKQLSVIKVKYNKLKSTIDAQKDQMKAITG